MAKLEFKDTKYMNVALPTLVVLLLISFFSFAYDSIKIVSETSKNNFTYVIKVREALEKVDVIIERSELSLNVLSDTIKQTYDTKKLYDKKYNLQYLDGIKGLTKAALSNSPGVSGTWVHLNQEIHTGEAYLWYVKENGKINNFKEQLDKESSSIRTLTPQDDPYYFEPIRLKKAYWSSLYTDPDTNVKMITLSQPVFKNNKLVCVVGTDISFDALQRALQNMQEDFNGSEIFLLNHQKNIIVSQLSKNRTDKVVNLSFLSTFKKEEPLTEHMIEYTENGVSKTAIMVDLSSDYSIILTFPNMLVFEGFDRLFKTTYFGLTVLTLLTIIVLFNRIKIIKINKRLENELLTQKAIINSVPSTMIIKNKEGVILDCNDRFLKVLGKKREDIVGKTAYDFFDKALADTVQQNDQTVLTTKKTLIEEQCYLKETGEKTFIRTYNVPLLDNKNEINGLLVTSVDITLLKQEQALLKQAKESAEAATAMKSNFLANMSHEIRTPLNGVVGFLQLLEDTETTELQNEFITDAKKSSELLLSIINEILDFSKIEAGKLQIDNTSFDIHSAIEDVAIIATANAGAKGVDVHSLICSDIPRKVFGDPGRLKQILNNLLGNAIKFTKEGEVLIYANMVSETEDSVVVSFKIKDTGIGIPQDKLKAIFESFTQADSSTTRKFGGTGLGLAISQKLAELMNGNINVKSEEGKGSSFTVTIPFKKDISKIHSLNETIRLSNEQKIFSDINILVVENKPTDLEIIRYYLRETKCIINEAHSIEEAIEITNKENHNIKAALISYKMQHLGEESLSSLIKSSEHSKEIPLILYTSLANCEDSNELSAQGFIGHITKPINQKELIGTIANAIHEKGTTDNNSNKVSMCFSSKPLNNEAKFNSNNKILVVEDCELNCKLILRVLSNFGLPCDLATDGKEAITAFESGTYDLILMDCEMPILDGYAATKAIREIESKLGSETSIPIIAMTANVLNTDREKCLAAGMNNYISKPLNIKALKTLIAEYIEISASADTSEDHSDKEGCIENVLDEIVEELGFTKSEAAELLTEYFQILPKSINELETAIESDDFESLKKMAHKLKGSSANMRIKKISNLSETLEKQITQSDKVSCLNTINEMKKLMNCISEVSPLLENYCKR